MNRASLPEMLHCTDMTVLERQRARLKWSTQDNFQQEMNYLNDLNGVFSLPETQQQIFGQGGFVGSGGDHSAMISEMLTRSVKPDPGTENSWPETSVVDYMTGNGLGFGGASGYGNGSGFELNYSAISRTSSCPPAVAAAAEEEAVDLKVKESVLSETMSTTIGKDQSFKKRKVDVEDESKEKKIKTCVEEEDSKLTNKNINKRENSGDTSKENSKVSEVQKPDYIHVRARRGQATDSHSLAERVRREKISERMKYLQDLVPGCNKITGKAGMLDEIINYVQSLQRQVEFLSMKLATVNPRLDFNIDNLLTKEVFPANFSSIDLPPEMNNPGFLQFDPIQQLVSCCGIEMGLNPSTDSGLRRTISAPVSNPNTFADSSCFNGIQQSSTWEIDFQNLYNNVGFDQGRGSTSFLSHPFTGSIEESDNIKMDM